MHIGTEFISTLRSLKLRATQDMKLHVEKGGPPGHIFVVYRNRVWWKELIRKSDGGIDWRRWEILT